MRSIYLKLHELLPPFLYENLDEELGWKLIDDNLIESIDKIKSVFPDGSMMINNYKWGGDRKWSGLRTADSQWYSPTSQHTKGKAIDAVFSAYDVNEVRGYILANPDEFPHIKGIEMDIAWLHVDTRSSKEVVLFYP